MDGFSRVQSVQQCPNVCVCMYVCPSLALSEVDPSLMKAALPMYERSSDVDCVVSAVLVANTNCIVSRRECSSVNGTSELNCD